MNKHNIRPVPTHVQLWLVIILLTGLALLLGPVHVGQAASIIVVNTFADSKSATDGLCSLREAVIAANQDKSSGNRAGECPAGSGADTIILPAGVYRLSRSDNGKEDAAATGDLDIRGDLTITGAGADVTIIDGSSITDRIFHVITGNVTISGVTIRNGSVRLGDGGGIYNASRLTLIDVLIETSSASGTGGGVYNSAVGDLNVSGSTIAGNTVTGDGGGIANHGTLSLSNSTISGNSSQVSGGGLFSSGTADLNAVTISYNTADSDSNGSGDGGGVATSGGVLTARNTIIAANEDKSTAVRRHDCSGALTSQGNNLIQDTTGCAIGGVTTGNLTGVAPLLAPLAANNGPTPTHALLPGSPAIDAGNNLTCPATDQRGVSRPQGPACDIGAFELGDTPQGGATLHVNSANDEDDGLCGVSHCSLREAINAANAGATINTILFNLPGGSSPPAILVQAALPPITDPVTIDGTSQPGGVVVLAPAGDFSGSDGLVLTAGQSTIRGLQINHFPGSGIVVDSSHNTIAGNNIAWNGGDGVRVLAGSGNTITANNIHDNGGLSIDLGGDGRTLNDKDDADSGANLQQNYPVLFRAVPGSQLAVTGRLHSQAEAVYTIEFFAGDGCAASPLGEQTFLGSAEVTTDAAGDVYFQVNDLPAVADGRFISATATDAQGNTSEVSDCVVTGPGNDSWPHAMVLSPLAGLPAVVEQYLDTAGQSRWYRFPVTPGSKLIVTLTNLPADYDLTLYKDIAAAFVALQTPQDLVQLGAEFAPEAFSPEAFSPEAFSPEAFSPEAFSPEAFSPEAFSPEAFSPEAFSPEAFSPEAFSPEAFSPDAFSPEAFSPEAFSPEAFSPEAFSPEAFSPEAFSSAQSRSLIGVSAFRGTAGEGLITNTWNNSGYFYVRVRGANGAFSQAAPFRLEVTMLPGTCGSVAPLTTAGTTTAVAGNYKTVILTDLARMAGTAAEKTALSARLATFAARPEVSGVIVDVGADARVAAANAQADAHLACPYAKNLLAGAIKGIVDAYWALNPLEYVVIVGNDGVIPFFRYADNALLANESNYVPPVRDATASQASLRLGFVLGQDAYGSRREVSFKSSTLPIPELGVGRLVETAAEATGMLDAYLAAAAGVVSLTAPPLVTGYDFLEDAALAVQEELELGTGLAADTLIAPQHLAPTDPAAWTADDLRAVLLGSRHDLMFLAGHFSASGALAADYLTRMVAEEVVNAPLDLQNAIIFSAGCHSGYNIVDADGVPLVTREPDWAQAFARKGATLIAGTGYQYGDTDFIEYGERLYLEFSRQLRTGSGPVSVGQALVEAKRIYLAGTPQMRGIHEKSLLQATIFGLPMLSVNMPGARLTPVTDASVVGATTPFTTNPGATLGLVYADVHVTPAFNTHTVQLTNVDDPQTSVTATYLAGLHGVLTNPAEPTLPLQMLNVTVTDTVLRGVGFRGGLYTDTPDILPLTGAPATEIRGVHAPFFANFFYPVQMWRANYYGALADPTAGLTRLALTPAQFISTQPGSQTGTLRRFDELDLRLYYSNHISAFGASVPALSAPPTIVSVAATIANGAVTFEVRVVGNPAAGIQEVWITYTGVQGSPFAGRWQSLNLSQDATDSTLWQGTLPLNGANPAHLRYVAQAANGVGLVSLATNLGAYYVPGAEVAVLQPTELALTAPVATGPYGSQASFSALLTSNGAPLPGQIITLGLGPQSRQAQTDANGQATVTLTLLGLPGQYDVRAAFAGAAGYQASSASRSFVITKQNTSLELTQPASGYPADNALLTATLTDVTGRRLSERTIFFVLMGDGGSASFVAITDYAGRATLGDVRPLRHGVYTVNAYFNGSIPLSTGETVTLDDSRYHPTQATGSLLLLNHVPVAVDDAYTMDQDTILAVDAAAGVLSNDSDADDDELTAVLVASPSHGSLELNPDGSFVYTPNTGFHGTDSFTYVASDGLDESNVATVMITVNPVNRPPDCSAAAPSIPFIWPPDNNFVSVNILAITDPDGDPVTIIITSIFQDEPVGVGANSPDGRGVGSSTAEVRAERDGSGDGRVYHISFTASDGRGGSCSSVIRVPVDHNRSNIDAIDGGPLYDSTIPG